jgi:hypothetical protein
MTVLRQGVCVSFVTTGPANAIRCRPHSQNGTPCPLIVPTRNRCMAHIRTPHKALLFSDAPDAEWAAR